MNFMTKFSMKALSFLLVFVLVMQMGIATVLGATVTIGNSDDAGDYAFFDSNYCHTSGADKKYNNFTKDDGSGANYIELYRLDYTNTRRQAFIYTEMMDTSANCGYEIWLERNYITNNRFKLYNYILIDGDFMTSVQESSATMFTLSGTNGSVTTDSNLKEKGVSLTVATLGKNGTFTFSDGSTYAAGIKPGQWFNYKIAVDLSKDTADIYVDGTKVKSALALSAMTRINFVKFALGKEGKGNMYADNLRIIGLDKAFVNGVETKTSIFPDTNAVESFLSGKVAFHGYGELMYKNGTKTPIDTVYDEAGKELYVPVSVINTAFDVSVSVNADGTYSGTKSGTLSVKPKTVDGVVYVPVSAFAKQAMGRYVYYHETGIFIVTTNGDTPNESGWNYQAFYENGSMRIWNDIDHLNAFLAYERPSVSTLAADFIGGTSSTQHPRVLINSSEFNRLKNLYNSGSDEFYTKMVRAKLAVANAYLQQATVPYGYQDDMRSLTNAGMLLDRFMHWGFAYNMTGDTAYVDRAYKELLSMEEYPDFNTSHIIDAGTYVMATAIAYDWFYNGFNEEQRALAKKICLERGLPSLAEGMYGRVVSSSNGSNRFVAFRQKNNYNSIIAGGCLCAAVATMENDPDYCLDVVANCLRSLEYSLAELMPGGSWAEGPSYWNYAFEFFNYAFATLFTSFGKDYGLTKTMGMDHTLDFAMATIGATGLNNFHDMGPSSAHSYEAFAYLAKLTKNKTAFDMRNAEIESGRSGASIEDVIYYNPSAFSSSAESDTVKYIRGIELFSVRDTYKKEDSQFFLSTHFGTTSGYHQHCDAGNFVLDMFGKRWAEDLGSENYNLQNEDKYTDGDMYRKRGEGHNIIVFNPANYGPTATHPVDGIPYNSQWEQTKNVYLPVERYDYDDNSAFVVTDMTKAYSKEVNSMKTGYYVDRDSENPAVTMRSEFDLKTTNSDVYWFMHTKATVKELNAAENYVILQNGDKTVKLQFETNATVSEFDVRAAKPLPTTTQTPGQNENTAYQKVAIRLKASGNTTLTVRIAGENYDKEMYTQYLDRWVLNDASSTLFEADCTADITKNGASISRLAAEDVTIIGGKASDDAVIKLTTNTAENGTSYNGYINYVWGKSTSATDWSEAGGTGYLTVSANVFPATDTASFQIVTDNSASVSGNLNLVKNQWNNVTVVYRREDGKANVFLNGVETGWQASNIGTVNTAGTAIRTSIRPIVYGSSATDYIYVDDMKIYTSSSVPYVAVPDISSAALTDGYDIAAVGMTVAQIKANCNYADITAYTDNTFKTAISDSTALAAGNRIVIVDNGIYATYTVVADVPETTYLINNPDGLELSMSRAVTQSNGQYALGGQGITDTSTYLKFQGWDGTNDDMFYQYQYPEEYIGVGKTVSFNLDMYYTYSGNNTIHDCTIATDTHATLYTISASSLKTGSWNRINAIFTGTSEDTSAGTITGTLDVYVNGAKITKTVTVKKRIIRFIVNCGYKREGYVYTYYVPEIYVDNVSITAGDIDTPPAPIKSGYSVSGAYLTVSGSPAVSTFVNNLNLTRKSYKVKVFNANGVQVGNDTIVTSGMTARIYNGSDFVTQYYIK